MAGRLPEQGPGTQAVPRGLSQDRSSAPHHTPHATQADVGTLGGPEEDAGDGQSVAVSS